MAGCNYHNNEYPNYVCSNKSLATGKCIFHDRDFLTPITKSLVQNEFYSLLNIAKKTNTQLICIGYVLPHLKINNRINFLIDFSHVRFTEAVEFSNARFSQLLCINTNFEQDVSFKEVIFTKNVEFTRARFKGLVDFRDAKFKETKFILTKFARVFFSGANFDEIANFTDAEFFEGAYFGQTKFHQNCLFDNSKFHKISYFSYAIFKEVNFSMCEFYNAHFLETRFIKDVKYNESKFTKVNFEKAEFHEKVEFVKTKFDLALFRKVKFIHPEKIFFNTDLSNVSFLFTKIDKEINFGAEIKWNGKNIIFDHIIFNDESDKYLEYKKDFFITDILAEYYDLRENFEFHFMYDRAGEFFVNEGELKRIFTDVRKIEESKSDDKIITIKKKSWFGRNISFRKVYKFIANYGESYIQPLRILGIIFIFSLIYFMGLESNGFNFHDINEVESSFFNSLKRSISANVPYISFIEDPKTIDYIIKAISLPLVGISFVGLKRRFERKYRH